MRPDPHSSPRPSIVILYKCHLFGVNPPALNGPTEGSHSSQPGVAGPSSPLAASDCSLCANIERKFRCQWCQNSCLHADQCPAMGQPAGAECPPPRIDSVS